LLANGTAMAVGSNQIGQLGDGTLIDRTTPVPVKSSGLWTAIGAGNANGIALKCFAGAKAWGKGDGGQLGNNGSANKLTPTAMVGLTTGVIAVAQGFDSTVVLKADGTVWSTGQNDVG